MKKFTDIKKTKKIFESDENKANLPENYKDLSKDELLDLLKKVDPSYTEKGEDGEVEKVEIKEVERLEDHLGEGSNPSKFFSKLFESREMAHIYHLQVKGDQGSLGKHLALGAYYDGVLDLVDDIIETFSGQYGLIEEYDIIDTKETRTKEPIEYFNELAKFIKVERKCINEEDTHLHNIIDEIVALVYKTLYKLKYNK